MSQEQPMFWTIKQVSERWGLSREFVRRLIDRGDLQAVPMGAGRRIPLREVQRAETYGIATHKLAVKK